MFDDDLMFMMFVLDEQKKYEFAKELAKPQYDPDDPADIEVAAAFTHINTRMLSEYEWKEIYRMIEEIRFNV